MIGHGKLFKNHRKTKPPLQEAAEIEPVGMTKKGRQIEAFGGLSFHALNRKRT